MKNTIKVAFLSSIITAAMVYVLLAWRPLQTESSRPPAVSWAAAGTSVAIPPAPATPEATASPAGDDERNNIDLYQRYSPGVVNITSTALAYDFFRRPVPMEAGTGSGAILDSEGHIVTNYHVIEPSLHGGQLQVTLADKGKFSATIVGKDPNNDLAVLKIDAPRSKLSPIPLGTSKGLMVGQKVLAIGNPYGLERTLTTGIISALGRSIQTENRRVIENIIQTDAAINPGNSGGPLLNSSGEIIGINAAIYSESGGNVGIGFAIPADTVKRIVGDLISIGYVRRPDLGVGSPVPVVDFGNLAPRLGINSEGGLLVVQTPSGPAAQAGIHGPSNEVIVFNMRIPVGGDVILALDGREVNSTGELGLAIDRHKAGDKVNVTILRGNRKMDVSVTLQEAPPER